MFSELVWGLGFFCLIGIGCYLVSKLLRFFRGHYVIPSKLEIKNTAAHLPEEICIEILERLPVKSLIQFKAVCKSWKSLISSPDFIDHHFDRSAANCSKLAMYEHESKIPIFHTLDFSPFSSGETTKIEVPKTMIPERRRGTCVCGECEEYYPKPEPISWCRGLLLLGVKSCNSSLLLWNPSTREYRDIPKPNKCRYSYEEMFASAIGYDFTTTSHKLLIIWQEGRERRKIRNHFRVYDLKTDLWTAVAVDKDHDQDAYYDDPPKTLVNGAPHWVVTYRRVLKLNHEIEYFDFGSNKFVSVPQPGVYECHVNYFNAELFDAEGRLCIGYHLCHNSSPKCEVWVMEEYGVEESWTKWMIFNVDIFGYTICFTKDMNFAVVGDKEIEIEIEIEGRSSRCFAIYNGERGIELDHLLGTCQLTPIRAFAFVESLISIK